MSTHTIKLVLDDRLYQALKRTAETEKRTIPNQLRHMLEADVVRWGYADAPPVQRFCSGERKMVLAKAPDFKCSECGGATIDPHTGKP